MTHTPEPWRITLHPSARKEPTLDAGEGVNSSSVAFLASESYLRNGTPDANAARIVACVNGCAGLNPAAYRQVVEALKEALPHVEHEHAPLNGEKHYCRTWNAGINACDCRVGRLKHALAAAEDSGNAPR